MLTYLMMIGPYDTGVIGPFQSPAEAERWKAEFLTWWRYDAVPLTKAELNDNIREFGKITVTTPDDYNSYCLKSNLE